jgi:hypothetical protein
VPPPFSLLLFPTFRRAAASRIDRAQAAIPSGSPDVASVIRVFCSLVNGIRRSVSMRKRPSLRGLAMPVL